jgi:hypothetical protein
VQSAPRVGHELLHVERDPARAFQVLELRAKEPRQEEFPEILIVGRQGMIERRPGSGSSMVFFMGKF